jgi:hypothetical protein
MRIALILMFFMSTCGYPLIAEEPDPTVLTIHTQAIETPVFRYRLFPPEAELKPGNAVPILLRMPWSQGNWMTKVFPTLEAWNALPLDAAEWNTSKGVLPESIYREMKRAAFRREALWEYPVGELSSPYMMLLPDVQELRVWLGSGLSARIRFHISRSEFAEAREGILVGLANSRHIARTTFYANQGVARALCNIMLTRVEELISQQNSPNLYWALSTLPDLQMELDRAANFEGSMFAMTFPAVQDFDRPRDADEWNRMAEQLVTFLEELDELPKQDISSPDVSAKIYVAKVVKQARTDLSTLVGILPEKVTQMTDSEVVVRWYAAIRIGYDERKAAVMMLPPNEAWPEMQKLQTEAASLKEKTGTSGSGYRPHLTYYSVWSLKRKIHALRIIEAVRHHASFHNGQLPKSLSELKDVPIPTDPLTNQPFSWEVKDKEASLEAPPLAADIVTMLRSGGFPTTQKYRLRMK